MIGVKGINRNEVGYNINEREIYEGGHKEITSRN
jgi:hypothetical protein